MELGNFRDMRNFVVGKGPEFYCKDSEIGEMAEHFDLNGRECVNEGV